MPPREWTSPDSTWSWSAGGVGAVGGPSVALGTCTTGSLDWVWHLELSFLEGSQLPELGLTPRIHLLIGMCKTRCQQHHRVAERSNDRPRNLMQAPFFSVFEIETLWELVDRSGGLFQGLISCSSTGVSPS